MGASLHFYYAKRENERYARICPLTSQSSSLSDGTTNDILRALEIPYDLENSHTFPIDTLITQCFLYLNTNSGTRAHHDKEIPVTQDGNWIDCGRAQGRITDHITYMHALAVRAKAMGAVNCGFF